MTLKQKAFIALQYIVPQHLLSHLVGWLAASEIRWIKNTFINFFIKQFGINMNEAKRKTADDFRCFNDFFTRELEDDARPVSATDNHRADLTTRHLGLFEPNVFISEIC